MTAEPHAVPAAPPADVPDGPDPSTAAPPAGPSTVARAADRALRVLGGVLGVAMALLSGLLELYLAPLRVAGVLIGVAALVAIPANVFLAWWAQRAVGARFAFALPWGAWTLLMFVAAGVRTDEGDQLLAPDNWVGMVLILAGSIAFAAYAYRSILGTVPRG
ncbi:hypothetical protein [Spirilliplanes yamanashiensis]|uniref:Uncharacterized protein n=1 Tax=Spirilliplanes yamanashiensis TaxID=42233 RepID=A0A8J3Y3V0_9ACTN|nr:hypothetical protein [Spirilliplanes yamanashiensis]MDP9814058.1 hypothetical protein [Spirilliplanes yamanashiensis]GIJ00962.1 hypothetical protein Sya03_03140 [Spirilliplanes yamanashiensis]